MHLHRSRVTTAAYPDRSSPRPPSQPTRQRPVSTPSKSTVVEHRTHFVVGERVARAFVRPGSIANATPDHLAVRVRRARPPESPGASARREHEDVAAALARAVDVGADRDDLLADTRRRTRAAVRRRGGRRPHPRRRRRPCRAAAPGASRSGTASTARSRTGSNATTVASCSSPSASSTVVSSSPATTCALVTTSPLADDPAAALLDLAARAPADLHDRLRGRCWSTSAGIAASGGQPGSGGSSSGAERRRVRRVGDRPAPRRELRRLLGRQVVDERRRRASRAPCARASPSPSRATGSSSRRGRARRACRSRRPRRGPSVGSGCPSPEKRCTTTPSARPTPARASRRGRGTAPRPSHGRRRSFRRTR